MTGYPQITMKVVMGGKVGADIWRTSLDFIVASSGVPTAAQMNSMITTGVQPSTLTFWNAIKGFQIPGCTYEYLSAYYYPIGATSAAAQGSASLTPVVGTGVAPWLPLRTCLVQTKLTGYSGRANKGRAYLPYTGNSSLTNDGQTANTTPNTFATAYAAWITALNGANWSIPAGLTGQQAIVTSAGAAAPGHAVVSVRCDSIPDTQRRRTNKDSADFFSTITV